MYADEFYERSTGRRPLEEWLQTRSTEERAVVNSKMQSLCEEGLLLLGNKVLKRIKNITKRDKQDPPVYELVCGQLRVGVYFDADRRVFVYLSGWKKQKDLERKEVEKCRTFLRDYLAARGG